LGVSLAMGRKSLDEELNPNPFTFIA